MSTRYKIDPYKTQSGISTGLEGVDIPADFDMPTCGIEDVDRAMFKLFNEDLPFYFESDGDMKRIPCIFASGERAFILRRKEPIRDRQGALILPLVSVLRTGIDQTAEKGIGPGDGLITVKKKVAPENRIYKRQVNSEGLKNQDDILGSAYSPNLGLGINTKNVYELITIPAPRFFKATYEITFWAQYLQQMNNIIEAFISSYNINAARTFKIESDKGYWFVATVESGLTDSTNFDEYTEDERMIKTSITMGVTGYIINPKYPGAPSPFRRYTSAPRISFSTSAENPPQIISGKLPSNNPEDYTFDDLNTNQYPLPGVAVGMVDNDGPSYSVNIGGVEKNNTLQAGKTIKNAHPTVNIADPFGEETVQAAVTAQNLANGEVAYIVLESYDFQSNKIEDL